MAKVQDDRKNNSRPSVVTEEVLEELRQGFLLGFNNQEASLFAGISHDALYNYQNRTPGYKEQVRQWKQNPVLLAKRNIFEELQNGNPEMSKWYLEKKAKSEFGTRIELTGADGNPIELLGTVRERFNQVMKESNAIIDNPERTLLDDWEDKRRTENLSELSSTDMQLSDADDLGQTAEWEKEPLHNSSAETL